MPDIYLGDVYLIPTPPNGSHYFVAITKLDNGSFLFVNYSTVRDSTPDEYLDFTISPSRTKIRFLTQESYFVFGSAKEYGSAELTALGATHKGAFSRDEVEKIQFAAITNNSLKNKYRKLIRTYLGLPPV